MKKSAVTPAIAPVRLAVGDEASNAYPVKRGGTLWVIAVYSTASQGKIYLTHK